MSKKFRMATSRLDKADHSDILFGVVRPDRWFEHSECTHHGGKLNYSLLEPLCQVATFGSRGGKRRWDDEVQILAEALKSGVDFRQTCSAFEHKTTIRCCQMVQQDSTVVIFLNKPWKKQSPGGCKVYGLPKQDGIFVQTYD